jgi:hypothetical protein
MLSSGTNTPLDLRSNRADSKQPTPALNAAGARKPARGLQTAPPAAMAARSATHQLDATAADEWDANPPLPPAHLPVRQQRPLSRQEAQAGSAAAGMASGGADMTAMMAGMAGAAGCAGGQMTQAQMQAIVQMCCQQMMQIGMVPVAPAGSVPPAAGNEPAMNSSSRPAATDALGQGQPGSERENVSANVVSGTDKLTEALVRCNAHQLSCVGVIALRPHARDKCLTSTPR